jgi:phage terminase large subunit-like protein
LTVTRSPAELPSLGYDWPFWACPDQLPPAGNWRYWLVLAGRGFGKTRIGAEWVRAKGVDRVRLDWSAKRIDFWSAAFMNELIHSALSIPGGYRFLRATAGWSGLLSNGRRPMPG